MSARHPEARSPTIISMEKLLMCRICLREEVPMQSIVDTHLEAMYESLTLMPFKTSDNRPDEVCDICCEKLQNCFQLWKRCLRSEELFTWMLNSNVQAPAKLEDVLRIHTPKETAELYLNMGGVKHKHIGSAIKMDSHEGLDDVDVKMEDSEVSGDEPFEEGDIESEENAQSSFVEDDIESEEDAQSSFVEDDIESEEDAQTSFVDDIESEDNAQSSFVEDDLFLPVTKEEPTDVTTCGSIPSKSTPAAAANSEDLTPNNFKEIEDVDINMEELKNNNNMTVNYKTVTNKKLLENHDKVNLYKEKNYHMTSEVKNVDKGKSFSKICLKINIPIRTHTGDKLYQCDVCKKCFTQKHILSKHIRRHNDEKPYQCNVCKKFFSTNNCTTFHFRTQNDGKPYTCKKYFN